MYSQRVFSVCLFLAASVSLAAARDLALVSNKANGVNALTMADLAKVCKAQTTRWPDGKAVTFIMRAPSAPEMRMVLEKVYELPEGEVKALVATANHGRTIVVPAGTRSFINSGDKDSLTVSSPVPTS